MQVGQRLSAKPKLEVEFLHRDHRIDVLRGFAIGIVLIHHFYLAYLVARNPIDGFSEQLLRAVGRNGNYGVIVFFVISGYLITSTSLRRFGDLRRLSARVFYIFRFARIFPCLVLILAVVTLLGQAGVPYFQNSHGVSFLVADLSVLTFWHNVLMAKDGWFNYCLNVLWSLSVEEVFYLSFPILWLGLRKTWLVIAVWVLVIVVGPVYRGLHLNDEIRYLCSYPACFDAIAMGCCTADTLAVIPGNQWSQPIAWFGRHSYELYLFHIIVLAGMRNLVSVAAGPLEKGGLFVIFITTSTSLAWVIAQYYSEPLNRRLRLRLLANEK